MKVLRITRHPLDADRLVFLWSIYGEDVEVITEDTPFGNDPIGAVKAAIDRVGGVAAVEVIAPFPILSRLVEARRELGVPLIRAAFRRDEGGRAVVVGKDAEGRDILAFSHYEELVRVSVETRPLQRRGS